MLRIAYVEDELSAATGLQNCLEGYGREHGLELQIRAYPTADALLQQYNPATDILFLDVELPGTSGMEAARQLRDRGYEGALVFVTNMAQYAVQGYEVDALDFLVKPVNPFAFTVKMNRILRRWFPKGTNFDQVTEAEVAQAAEWMNNYPRRILGWRSAGAVFEEYVAA